MANRWTHWATLTFSPIEAAKESYSYLEAKEAFMSWRKSVVRQYGCDMKYMAVSEYGEKFKRIHWHALLYFDKRIKFKQARSPKGKKLYLMNSQHKNVLDGNGKSIPKLELPKWKYGLTDFYPIYNDQSRAISYISKYMTKGEGTAPYEQQGMRSKSYLASKGLKKPQKEYLQVGEDSKLLSPTTQSKIEQASPVFKLLSDGKEVMHKSEAVRDKHGEIHVIRRITTVIDIKKSGKK